MSQIEIDRVLSTIRSIKAQTNIAGPVGANIGSVAGTAAGKPNSVSFASVLKGGIDEVNRVQQTGGRRGSQPGRVRVSRHHEYAGLMCRAHWSN